MSILIRGIEMPPQGEFKHIRIYDNGEVTVQVDTGEEVYEAVIAHAVQVPPHGRLIDADELTGQMERNLWTIEDKAEKELGFDETLRRGMQHGHAVCLNAVNDAPTIIEAEGEK